MLLCVTLAFPWPCHLCWAIDRLFLVKQADFLVNSARRSRAPGHLCPEKATIGAAPGEGERCGVLMGIGRLNNFDASHGLSIFMSCVDVPTK